MGTSSRCSAVSILGRSGTPGVELVGARRPPPDPQDLQDAAHRWALPLLATGIVLAIAALALPGRRGPRAIWLGILIAAERGPLFFTTGLVGSQLATQASQPASGVVDALWVSAAPSIRTWLGGAFMGGLLVVTIGFLVDAEHD